MQLSFSYYDIILPIVVYIITTLLIGHAICILTKKNLIGQSDTQGNTTHYYLFISPTTFLALQLLLC